MAVMPFDPLPQWQGQFGPVLVPRPAGRQIRHDRAEAALWNILVKHHQIVEHPIIGPSANTVASSRIDMLAGLSGENILRMPPCFWANAVSLADVAISNVTAASAMRRVSVISLVSLFRRHCEPRVRAARGPRTGSAKQSRSRCARRTEIALSLRSSQ